MNSTLQDSSVDLGGVTRSASADLGPEQADISGTAESGIAHFFSELNNEALDHRALHHPYLKALADGDLPDLKWALQDFATQYYGYSGHFIRYLTLVISRLENGGHRRKLMENLLEESGKLDSDELDLLAAIGIDAEWVQGIPHPELFRRFQTAIQAQPFSDEDPDSLEAVCWRENFLALLTYGSPAEAVGAIGFGTETIVKHIYDPLLAGIARYGVLHPKDYVFFTMHTLIDDYHSASLEEIAKDLCADPKARNDLRKGMIKALNMRVAFWDWMYERALARGRVA